MKRFAVAWFVFLVTLGPGCVPPVKPNPPVPAPKPPAANYYDRTIAAVIVDDRSGVPVANAAVTLDGGPAGTTDGNGYVSLFPVKSTDTARQLSVSATGYDDYSAHVDLPADQDYQITPPVAIHRRLPPAPGRGEMLAVHITFQGLTVDTQQYGRLPWFEAALAWLSPQDRQAVYAAKRASTAWPGGDTHAIIQLPSGPPLYDEAGQPYSADRFGPLDWTAGGTHVDGRLADLVVEVANAGYPRVLLFLGGDDGQRGYPIAMAQLDLVHDALASSTYGDLRPYVVVLPGWDGVFYGYTPDQVASWGAKCRDLFLYCGMEHQPGRIPLGDGGGDFQPGGRMQTFDLILAEFDGPRDSAWRLGNRTVDSQGRVGYNGSQIWQIASRMLGPAFRRQSDEPSDADNNFDGRNWFLAAGSPRGPYQHCAFEWVGEYLWVRGQESADEVVRDREYFKSNGYTCGG